jgi:hypothetical protein
MNMPTKIKRVRGAKRKMQEGKSKGGMCRKQCEVDLLFRAFCKVSVSFLSLNSPRIWSFVISQAGENEQIPHEHLSKVHLRGIRRWRLEVGSRKRASYSEILERRWRHTLQA